MNALTSTRLQIAINLVLEDVKDGDLILKTLILESLKEEEPIVKNVLELYGVD